MMMWSVPMTWNDRVHVGSAMVAEGRGHVMEFDESMVEIIFDFEINNLDSS
jgi:hypothetical protein